MWAKATARVRVWIRQNGRCALSTCHRAGDRGLPRFPDNGGTRGQLGCRLPGQRTKNIAETTKTLATEGDKQQLGDVEKQGLFSTGAGSEESPPESEHQVFVLRNFYTLEGLGFPM